MSSHQGGISHEKLKALEAKLKSFMKTHIYPNEETFLQQCHDMEKRGDWGNIPIVKQLQAKAKAENLWNLFLPVDSGNKQFSGYGLTNLQYAGLCEIMGTSNPMEFAAEVFNCSSPDTGNMEILARFGTPEQQKRWLGPLLNGNIRSCFGMTEPAVASSDASNIQCSIVRDGSEYVINGRKWWITGAGSWNCKLMILMGKTDPSARKYRQQSMVLVPMDAKGLTIVRPMHVFGHAHAPKGHMEIVLKDVRVPVDNVLLGEGRGFEIAQARLGPGRIHHCMRCIGTAERALAAMCFRSRSRMAFGKLLAAQGLVQHRIAQCRADIDMARLLVRNAADMMDKHGNKVARQALSMVKAVVPSMLQRVVDHAIQVHGAAGLSQDTFFCAALGGARTLRLADGPDEVHWKTVGLLELRAQGNANYGDMPVSATKPAKEHVVYRSKL